MDVSTLPIEAQLAFVLPGWTVLGLLLISVAICIAFFCATRKYVRELKENFPHLNFKINCILFVLMSLAMIAQIAVHMELGVRGHAGIGWLHFFVAKYFISKRIINNDSEYGYISNTILVYALTFGTTCILSLLVWEIIGRTL